MNIYEVGKELLKNPYGVYRADIMGLNKYSYVSWNEDSMQYCDRYRNFEFFAMVEIDEGTIESYWEKVYDFKEIIDWAVDLNLENIFELDKKNIY